MCDYGGDGCFSILSNDVLRGKVLKINPETGFGVPSNPFFSKFKPTSNSSKVFLTGLRNPWGIAQLPGANPKVAVWDVGGDYRESLKILSKTEFGGWPCREGKMAHLPGLCSSAQNASMTTHLIDYPHSEGNACIIGGVFVPLTFRSALAGRIVWSDYGSGLFWAAKLVNGVPTDKVLLGESPGAVRMVLGPLGKIWVMNYGDSAIWELMDSTPKLSKGQR